MRWRAALLLTSVALLGPPPGAEGRQRQSRRPAARSGEYEPAVPGGARPAPPVLAVSGEPPTAHTDLVPATPGVVPLAGTGAPPAGTPVSSPSAEARSLTEGGVTAPLSPGPSPGLPALERDPPLGPLRQRVERSDHYRLRAPLSLPFTGTWIAYHASPGGRNTHGRNLNQRHAVDWLMARATEDGRRRTCREPCRDNSDFFAYGQPVLAPADGQIVQVVDGVPDNSPGQVDVYFRLGNTVVIRLGPGEYAYLAHLQPGSITVRPGDLVRRGQVVARCGNSGNSSEPHLHFQVADSPHITQAASLPPLFRRVLRNGQPVEESLPQSGEVYAPQPEEEP